MSTMLIARSHEIDAAPAISGKGAKPIDTFTDSRVPW